MKSLETLLNEEKDLVFKHFDNTTACFLGKSAMEKAVREKLSLAISVQCKGITMFSAFLNGTCRDNVHWIRGKQRLCRYFQHSTLYTARLMEKKGKTLESYYLDPSRYRAKGGAFPLMMEGCGMIGSLTISGLKDHEDHDFAVEVIREYLIHG